MERISPGELHERLHRVLEKPRPHDADVMASLRRLMTDQNRRTVRLPLLLILVPTAIALLFILLGIEANPSLRW